jgi:hypothetical protein
MTHRITKAQREIVKAKFGGRCAYCGEALGARWHVDHLLPIKRDFRWERGNGFVPTGECEHPDRHNIDNLMPACAPCNIDKHSDTLEGWRAKLADACGVLERNQSTYRFARKYGLIVETGNRVKFHFERVRESQS